jgi:hypothetical protein
MSCLLFSLLCAVLPASDANPAPIEPSFLYEPAYCMDNILRGQAHAYVPQPGDIMMYTDSNQFWNITHILALAFEPHGSGIVFARPDGSLAIAEAGANDTLSVHVLDLLPHLREYEAKGPVWIRKRRTPLTAEQSACLTDFAMRQEGKWFALIRLGGQLTLLRCRGPLRTYFVGKPQGDRSSYYCSELVTESLVAAGLVAAENARPAATYPHDLFFDRSLNIFLNRHFKLACDWEPPARWVSCPAAEAPGKPHMPSCR